jgi:hypothetical protein
MSRRIFFIPVLLVCCLRSGAQHLFDTASYIKLYDKTLWSAYINSVANNISLQQNYNLNTSQKTKLSVAVESLQEYGISYTNYKRTVMINLFGVPGLEANRKPTPKYFNIAYSQNGRNNLVETGISNFSGYYERNSGNVINNYNDLLPYYSYVKLQGTNAFVQYILFKNYKKFSYRAAYNHTAIQKKTAATFLYFLNVGYNRLKNDSAFIPVTVRNEYAQFGSMNRLLNLHTVVGIGGSGTLVLFKSFYANGTMMLGPGLQFQRFSLQSGSGPANQVKPIYMGDARFAFGINLKRFVLSNATLINFKAFNLGKINISNTHISNRFAIGYRFASKNSRKIRR